jgi:LisH-like dimerisation domain/WD domain, G-beta repeat
MSATNSSIEIPAADVIRLILAHLMEAGLPDTCEVLRQESGIGLAGIGVAWTSLAAAGDWATILQQLSLLDLERAAPVRTRKAVGENDEPRQSLTAELMQLVAAVQEMTILELAAQKDFELAYATYRLVQKELENASEAAYPVAQEATADPTTAGWSRGRLLEQKIAALASRVVDATTSTDADTSLPTDYYYGQTRDERREALGRLLDDTIPAPPPRRLVSLLQQAVKWQSYTGELPMIKQLFPENDSKPRKRQRIFDLVLGQVDVDPISVGAEILWNDPNVPVEDIVQEPYATLKFGKKVAVECAVFLPDGSGLVTGSSDGLIEIWDPSQKYQELRVDLPYQQKEELLGHDDGAVTALAVSNDTTLLASGDVTGLLRVWRIDTGLCLREFTAHHQAVVSHLSFSPDASHLLTASSDGTCREFGLRAGRMLKEFHGHSSYVHSCSYQLGTAASHPLLVVTGSADGTVRIWDAKTAELVR